MRAVNVTNALQQVIPFYQLLTFIPSQMCQDTDMQAPCTVTANNLCKYTNDQTIVKTYLLHRNRSGEGLRTIISIY